MTFPQRYELETSSRWLFLASPWIMVAFALLCVALPILPDEGKPRNETFLLVFSIVCGSFFSIGAWLCFGIVRRLPDAAMTVDEEGIWPTIRTREVALVRWADVARLRERDLMQRLELIDRAGAVVARLEYQLRDFSLLRTVVLAHAKLERATHSVQGVYQKSKWHHVFTIGTMIGFALLGWYVGDEQPLIGYGGMALVVGMIAWEYWTTPFRIRIRPRQLEIDRPWHCQIVPREHVAGIEIEDELLNHAKHPKVTIRLVNSSKPVNLKAVGLPAVELHQILHEWRTGDA
jgi:hypothetical protein